jgi:hypothetical protein
VRSEHAVTSSRPRKANAFMRVCRGVYQGANAKLLAAIAVIASRLTSAVLPG